jgi:hypothetical protein
MRTSTLLIFSAALVSIVVFVPAIKQEAQAQISISIGAEPSCPYGYYDYAPYNCAPDGYYGPEWFNGGHFIGAGKWFHGPANFHGSVNNHFDPQHGYKGPAPQHGPTQAPKAHFTPNEDRDGQGHATPHRG